MAPFHPITRVCREEIQMWEEVTEFLRQLISATRQEDKKTDRRLFVALSGGSTPKSLNTYLATKSPELVQQDMMYFLGDERVVAPDHADSNYHMIKNSLLVPANIDPAIVHPIITEAPSADAKAAAEEAATKYEELLRKTLPISDGVPVFDVVFLGLGPDGHTASLFPGTPAAKEMARMVTLCVPPEGVSPAVARVTITAPVIQYARHVVVLARGAGKKSVMEGILSDSVPEGTAAPVARLLRECRGTVHFYVDDEASPARETVRAAAAAAATVAAEGSISPSNVSTTGAEKAVSVQPPLQSP